MSDNLPKISIITSVFNAVDTIEDCILSVLKLNYNNIEFIIIDGGSTDGTLLLINNYLNKIDYFISENDFGIYDAWNKGILISTGQWILFLGADDKLKVDAISNLTAPIINPLIKFNGDYISGRSEIIHNTFLLRISGDKWNWSTFRKYMSTAQCAALHNRNLYNEIGFYDVSFKIAGDYELLLRKKDKLKTFFIDKVVVEFRTGGVSNRNSRVLLESFKAIRKNNSLNIWLAVLNLVKSYLIKIYNDKIK
uniref:glycosyltransferase family 2 protein n=1 Tax=Algoriphagus sp. TaxID=1872435 RepID=UPI0040476911